MAEPLLRLRLLWLLIGWAMVGFVTWVSLTPSPPQPPVSFPSIDKVEHLIAYAGLMGWFAQIYRLRLSRAVAAAGLVVMGVGLEILQGLGGVRYFEYWDMAANSSGVLLGWLAARGPLGELLIRLEGRVLR